MKNFLKLLTGGAKSISDFNGMWDHAAKKNWSEARLKLESGANNLGIEVPSEGAPFEVNLTFLQIEIFSGDGYRIGEAIDACREQISRGNISGSRDEKCYLIAYFNRLQELHTADKTRANECPYNLDKVAGYIKARYPIA